MVPFEPFDVEQIQVTQAKAPAAVVIRRNVKVLCRVRAWWWTTEANKIAMHIHYGARKIEISKGKTAVEMTSMAELVPTLELIKQAVEAGELDAQIEVAAMKLRDGFGK